MPNSRQIFGDIDGHTIIASYSDHKGQSQILKGRRVTDHCNGIKWVFKTSYVLNKSDNNGWLPLSFPGAI